MSGLRIAIHDRPGSFSDHWIAWCEREGIDHVVVDAHRSDIVPHLRERGCHGLMWHWHHNDFAAQLFARQLTLALERGGIAVFPSVDTAWHFDDKVAQKYLFEAVRVPSVPSAVFYRPDAALAWLRAQEFPLVFKLRGGAASQNVRLVRDVDEAERLVRRAFGSGFPPVDPYAIARQQLWSYRRDAKTLKGLLRVPYYYLRAILGVKPRNAGLRPPERGYLYVQEFIEGNDFDDRFVVVGDRCYAMRRFVRKGDFRASGSGVKSFDRRLFSERALRIAFDAAAKVGAQSMAIDVVYRGDGEPLVVEASYAFVTDLFDGYFDRELVWHEGASVPQEAMIEDFVRSLQGGPA